jgi:hypothetical protein
MKRYEIVIHNIGGRYIKEVYSRDSQNNLTFVNEEEANKIPNNYENKEVYELIHSSDYKKVKSPFTGEDGKKIYLFGRYINISCRIPDEKNRF